MPMTPEAYEEKKQRRIDRLHRRANHLKNLSNQAYQTAHNRAQAIPFGQPILVGHYSEGRDRRYRVRIEAGFRKSFELQKKAEYYEDRAEAAENNNTISSDDPQAIEKLKEKLAGLERDQVQMKKVNVLARKGDRQGLLDMGLTESTVHRLMTGEGDICRQKGFPAYMLTNNNANIRRIRERIKQLEAQAKAQGGEKQIGEIQIIQNIEMNRVQIVFPGKPPKEVREALKLHGFVWAPSQNAWQRQRSNQAMYWAEQVINQFYGEGTK